MRKVYIGVLLLALLFVIPSLSIAACTDSAFFKLTIPYCFGSAASFTNQSSGTPTAYLWNFGDPPSGAANTSTSANPSHSFTAIGNYNVCLIAYYATCNDTFCTNVNADTLHRIPETVQNICLGTTAQLNVNIPGATSYLWLDSTDLSCGTCPNPVATPRQGTVYVVSVSNGTCSNTDTTAVNVTPIPDPKTGPDVTICLGASTTLNATGANDYSWSPAAGLSNPNIADPVASPTVTTTYTVTGTNPPSCTGTAVITVTVVTQIPVVTVSNDTSICGGATVNLNAGGAATYTWLPAAGLNNPDISNPTADPASTTTYTVTGTNAQGCGVTATVTVSVEPPPDANAGPDVTLCLGHSVQLHGSGGTTYLWQPSTGLSDSTISDPTVTLPNLGTYTYTLTTSTGKLCPPSTSTVVVTVNQGPLINASPPDTTIEAGSNIVLNVTGTGTSYTWSYNPTLSCLTCQDPVANPTESTYYYVTTTDSSSGCSNTDTVFVNVDDQMTLYLSNAFTPGSANGENEIFYAYGIGIRDLDFYIYDRWGEQIFASHNPADGWDGTYKGSIVKEDVYVYLCTATSYAGVVITKTGAVTVVK